MRSALLAALFFVVIAVGVSLLPAEAQVPRKFNYQAALRDPDGKLITGSVSLFISLHDQEVGGSTIFSENPILDIVNGRVEGTIPFTEPEFRDDFWFPILESKELWIEVTVSEVDGNPTNWTFPRQQFLTQGYSLGTASIDEATGGTVRGGLTIDGDLRLPEGIELTTNGGTLTITAGASSITMAPDGTLTITSADVRVESAGDIAFAAAGDVDIDGTNVRVTAQAEAVVEGAANAELRSSGTTKAVGSLVMIN